MSWSCWSSVWAIGVASTGHDDEVQSRVSRIERGAIDHTQLETLRAYLEALGGELEVSARFGDERILIAG